ncbi:MAG: rhodanese-like domain-containing protein [Planctomycetota bacterium]
MAPARQGPGAPACERFGARPEHGAARIDEIDEEKTVVVMCHHGIRSLSVAAVLRSIGFEEAYSMAGGIDRWSMEIDQAVPRY